jgi:regulator of protease activity HflC (stomatin/prohibitin superfamily)
MAPLLLSQCAIIEPGEVGIKQRLGKLKNEPVTAGLIGYNPLISRVIKTNNLLLSLNLPSKEGLSVQADISILYHVDNTKFKQLLTQYGTDYEPVITAIFRSAASDVCAQYFAKDMHSGKRSEIEITIYKRMLENLEGSGMVVENVLMKSISLPKGLATSIEQKLQAEQDAMRMEFILQQEKLEAERKIIQAKGTRDAQLIQAEGLTPEILKMRSIDAFQELSKSPNAKVIVTDGKTPFLIKD